MNLKPCLFCSANAADMVAPSPASITRFMPYVLCRNCRAQGPHKETEADAAEAWNEADARVERDLAARDAVNLRAELDRLRERRDPLNGGAR